MAQHFAVKFEFRKMSILESHQPLTDELIYFNLMTNRNIYCIGIWLCPIMPVPEEGCGVY
jgi:hypothetical protein